MRTIDINKEEILQIAHNKEWEKLLKLLKDNKKYSLIREDEMLRPFIETYFINDLLSDDSKKADLAYKFYLQQFYSLHCGGNFDFKLSEHDFKRLVIRIVEVESNIQNAYNYASHFPEEEICKTVINKFKITQRESISHSQNDNLTVTQNAYIQNIDATRGLFRSVQEYHFYKAVREVYQTFIVLPNAALNAVIEFDSICSQLSPEERNFFFKGLIDCVVVDSENDFKPIKFFELDSPYHDNDKQKQNDNYKDNILAKAGQRLLRIRRHSPKDNESDFAKLIREVIRK